MTDDPALDTIPTGVLIDGAWRPASGGGTFDVLDPATGDVLRTVADATPADGAAALDAVAGSAEEWRAVAPRERAELLRAVYDSVVARGDEFAAVITAESGKPLAEARAEVAYGADFLRWFSEQAVRIDGLARRAPGGGNHQLVLRRAVGPSLLVTPWNFPLAMATRKLAPALAAGCTALVKPAEEAPLTTALLGEAVRAQLAARGLPAGVLAVLPTAAPGPVVAPLLDDPRLRKLSFTGSTAVGRSLLRASAARVLRTSLELGGNAPFLVFDDADIEAAVAGALVAKLRNAGQSCVAANRFLVQADVAPAFTAALADAVESQIVGPPTAAGTTVGPLIEPSAVERMEALVDDARSKGARVATGGGPVPGPGFFWTPTVVDGMAPDARAMTEEIFGPLAPVMAFGDEDEAIELANATEHGLVAYLWTRDVGRVLRLAERLETGMVGVNRGMVSDASAPFGGVKTSGLGREGGEAGLEEFLEPQYLAL